MLRVVDGDTIIVTPTDVATPELLRVSVRLYGIDAPEMSQSGGEESKVALKQLAQPGDTLNILTMESDKYDRLVGVIIHNGVVLNVEMVRSGHAQIYEKYCRASFCREWENIKTE